jgi:hypothetical protein
MFFSYPLLLSEPSPKDSTELSARAEGGRRDMSRDLIGTCLQVSCHDPPWRPCRGLQSLGPLDLCSRIADAGGAPASAWHSCAWSTHCCRTSLVTCHRVCHQRTAVGKSVLPCLLPNVSRTCWCEVPFTTAFPILPLFSPWWVLQGTLRAAGQGRAQRCALGAWTAALWAWWPCHAALSFLEPAHTPNSHRWRTFWAHSGTSRPTKWA